MTRTKSLSLWYPEYPGDYARKTGHLSMSQHGAYLLLRQHYYSTGRPLPTNVTSLYRICGALEDAEKADVNAIIAEFFTLEADGYHNSRCDEEIAKRGDIRKKRQAAVAARADRQGKKPATIEPTFVTTPTPTPTVEEREGKPSLAHPPVGEGAKPDKFGKFWDAYPHRGGLKKGRAVAEKRFAAAVKRGTPPDTIIAGAKAAHEHPDVIRGFARDPSTWLNQEGWRDEFGSSGGSSGSSGYWTSMGYIPEAAQ